jgi:hypothetical protein
MAGRRNVSEEDMSRLDVIIHALADVERTIEQSMSGKKSKPPNPYSTSSTREDPGSRNPKQPRNLFFVSEQARMWEQGHQAGIAGHNFESRQTAAKEGYRAGVDTLGRLNPAKVLTDIRNIGIELKTLKTALAKTNVVGRVDLKIVEGYTTAGLPLEFATALARDEANHDSILALWRADWKAQYQDDDPLLVAILDGRLSEAQGKALHAVRSDHPEMVTEVINQTLTFEWADQLLHAGFNGHIEAVEAARLGAEPRIVVKIQDLKGVDVEALPPRRTSGV